MVRDTLGWVSLITLFWAGTIWAYLLFFHKPVESEVPQSATKISGVAPSETGHDKMEHGSPTHGGKQKANDAEHAPAASGDHAAASEKSADAKKPHDAHNTKQTRGGH